MTSAMHHDFLKIWAKEKIFDERRMKVGEQKKLELTPWCGDHEDYQYSYPVQLYILDRSLRIVLLVSHTFNLVFLISQHVESLLLKWTFTIVTCNFLGYRNYVLNMMYHYVAWGSIRVQYDSLITNVLLEGKRVEQVEQAWKHSERCEQLYIYVRSRI